VAITGLPEQKRWVPGAAVQLPCRNRNNQEGNIYGLGYSAMFEKSPALSSPGDKIFFIEGKSEKIP